MYRKSYDDNISFRKHVQKLCANIVFTSYDFPQKKIRRKNFSKKGMKSAVGRSRASWASRARARNSMAHKSEVGPDCCGRGAR